MEGRELIVQSFKNKRNARRAALTAGFFIVVAILYLFFPVRSMDFLKSGGAIALESWKSVFGGGSSGFLSSEIDISGTTSTEDASLGSSSPDFPGDDDGAGIFPTEISVGTGVNKSSTLKSPTKTKTTSADNASSSVILFPNASPENISSSDENTTSSAISGSQTDSENSTSTIAVSVPQCTFSSSSVAQPTRQIILNEVAWMGSAATSGETASQASDREWMELKNISSSSIALSNWQVEDPSGNIKIIFSATSTIAPGGFFLLERGENAVPGISADALYSGALSNTGDELAIFDGDCAVSDFLDTTSGWPGGNNTTKQTLERNADGVAWHTSVPAGGTPKAENSIPATPVVPSGGGAGGSGATQTIIATSTDITASSTDGSSSSATSTTPVSTSSTTPNCPPAHLVIADIEIAGTTSANDFVRFFNPTASAVDVGGWKLRKKSSTGTDSSVKELSMGTSVPAGGYFTWANSADGFGDSISANVTSTATLAADNSIALLDASGTIVDQVAWGTGTDQYVEGTAFGSDPGANQTLSRIFLAGAILDTDNNASDFTLQ